MNCARGAGWGRVLCLHTIEHFKSIELAETVASVGIKLFIHMKKGIVASLERDRIYHGNFRFNLKN